MVKVYSGSLNLGGIEVDCYTIDNGGGVERVIDSEGLNKLFGSSMENLGKLNYILFECNGIKKSGINVIDFIDFCNYVISKDSFSKEVKDRCNSILFKSFAKGSSMRGGISN